MRLSAHLVMIFLLCGLSAAQPGTIMKTVELGNQTMQIVCDQGNTFMVFDTLVEDSNVTLFWQVGRVTYFNETNASKAEISAPKGYYVSHNTLVPCGEEFVVRAKINGVTYSYRYTPEP